MANKKRILIADDDREFVEMLSIQLEAAGYETVFAYEGIRAIELAHKERPDLIILDWKMPAGEGGSVLSFLAKEDDTKHIPVIILTGVDEPEVEEKALKLKAKAFIHKPYEPRALLQKIREVFQWREYKESL